MKQTIWHNLKLSDIYKELKSSARGLDDKEAQARRKKFGTNELPRSKPLSSWIIFLNQIRSPLAYVLMFAAVVSLFLRHFTDGGVIIAIIIINSCFGYFQEKKANQAMEKLKQIIRRQAIVIHNGRRLRLDASDLVPGDVIAIRAGDNVPADCRIITAHNLQLIEAPLTGESLPSDKEETALEAGTPLADRDNMIYMGTNVARGEGLAIVCETGLNTEIGKISEMIKETKEERTPLQLQMLGLVKFLAIIISIICLAIFILGLGSGIDPVEIFLTVTALVVASIPEGLLIGVTVVLTIGIQKILRQKALVRKLIAAETLGKTSIICTDKTGTLTEGKMEIAKIITADQEYLIEPSPKKIDKARELIFKASILCSSADVENPDDALDNLKIIGDPTERALLLGAIISGYDKEKLDLEYSKLMILPFDSEKKYMATLHEQNSQGHRHIFAKGAPEKILNFCGFRLAGGEKKKISAADLEDLKRKFQALTAKGFRLLAVAYKTGQFIKLEGELNNLTFLGFIALKDPLRPDAAASLRLCQQAGIRTILVTGDHPLTAKAIFSELGIKIDHNIALGSDLDSWNDQELKNRIRDIDIFARVEPRHKLRIVAAWQKQNEVVAMTGDGINDAPAIKAADIGIALGESTDVTKETADIVLLDNNFKVIVSAIKQGRIIFDNIRKVVLYLLSDSFTEIILISGAILMKLPMPIFPLQILWVNLVADGLPNLAMATEKGEKGIMNLPPRARTEPLLNREMKILIFAISIIVDLALLSLFVFMLRLHYDLTYIRTLIFAATGFDSLLYAFSVRSLKSSIFTENPFKNKYLVGAIVVSFFVLIAAIYVPFMQMLFKTVNLGFNDWTIIVSLAVFKVILIEIIKQVFIIKKKGYLKIKTA